jgi:homoserine kinase type II
MDGGRENTSYCVETSSARYVLTLCDQKSLQQATNLATLLVYLTDRGIRTSRVIVPPNEPIVVLHNEKPVMLKRYVDGDVTANLTGNLLVQLGAEMARLHEIPAPQHLPMALIHGDVFFDNVIVQDDQLVAIIDFEEACHYYRNFDLGMAIVGACRDRKGISFEKAGRFIRGYEKQTNISSKERETLKTFAVYAAVATSFWRFRQYHLCRPEPQHFDKHVEMQTLADTISAYPDSSFTELFG